MSTILLDWLEVWATWNFTHFGMFGLWGMAGEMWLVMACIITPKDHL